MTIPQIIAAVWLTAGPAACVFACASFYVSSRADDRTRNNAAGEVGEGRGVKAFDTHYGASDK